MRKIRSDICTTPIAYITRHYDLLSSKAIELRSKTIVYGVVEREITVAEVEIECEVGKKKEKQN